MGLAFNAHSALEDVKALQSLVIHHKVSYEIMLKHSFGVDFIISSIESKSKTNELIATLAPLSSCISPYMLKKLPCMDCLMTILDLLLKGVVLMV